MQKRLVRYHVSGHTHFVTFSCYRREPYLRRGQERELFERSLETMRARYDFQVFGYVVMPEHVHLLVSEPKKCLLPEALQALKLSVSVRQRKRPFWQARYYDFNVFTMAKHVEKLQYIPRNPLVRGLVAKPEDWVWSSYRHYLTGENGTVRIESWWVSQWRGDGVVLGIADPTSQKRDVGHPDFIDCGEKR
jgi:putative transposase